MSFDFHREYEVHVILGDPTAPEPWQSDVWPEIFRTLQPIAARSRGTPVTASAQFEDAKNKPVKFGRIGWNLDGHAKWTHRAETTHRFLNVETWAPSRAACSKDGSPPDFLFLLANQGFFAKEPTFRDTVLLAVPASDAVSVQLCSDAAAQLAKIVRAKFHGRMKRSWARPFGTMFTDALGDMPTTGLFRVGPVHRETPGNGILAEQWEPLPIP